MGGTYNFEPNPLPVANGGTGGKSWSQIARKIAMNLPSQMTFIPFGDSETAGSSVAVSGLWQYGATALYDQAIAASGGRYREIRNAGVAGNTTTQMLARTQSDVVTYSPNVCTVHGGTNDFSSGMANSVYVTMMNNLEQIIIQLLDASILPVLVVPYAKNSAPNEAKRARWFYFQLASYYGIPIIDLHRLTVDPTNGNFLASYTADGTHLNPTGIAAALPIVKNVLANINSPTQTLYLGDVDETTTTEMSNLCKGGLFTTANTVSSVWSPNTTNGSYITPAAPSPYNGNSFVYTRTASGVAYALYGNNSTTQFSVGDSFYFACRMATSGLIPASATGCYTQIVCAGSANAQFTTVYNDDFISVQQFVIPASTTSIAFNFLVNDSAIYTISNITFVNATTYANIWKPGQQGIV